MSCDPHAITLEIKIGAKSQKLAALVPETESHIRNYQKELRSRLKEEIPE